MIPPKPIPSLDIPGRQPSYWSWPWRIHKILAAIFAVLCLSSHARAQFTVAREVVQEAVEQIFRQAGKEELNAIAEMGGRTAVRELMEQSANEGGEALVKKVVQYGAADGPLALRVISHAPAKMIETLDGLAPEMRGPAMKAIDRDPEVMTSLVKRFGTGAVEVAVRNPGASEILLLKLDEDGVRLGRSLSPDESVLVARHADEIAALSPRDRTSVIAKILSSPGPMLSFLERHPKVLLTAAGVTLFLSAKSELLGDGGISQIAGGGKIATTPPHPGFIERLFSPLVASFQRVVTLIGSLLAAGVAGWLTLHLFGKWRRERAAAGDPSRSSVK